MERLEAVPDGLAGVADRLLQVADFLPRVSDGIPRVTTRLQEPWTGFRRVTTRQVGGRRACRESRLCQQRSRIGIHVSWQESSLTESARRASLRAGRLRQWRPPRLLLPGREGASPATRPWRMARARKPEGQRPPATEDSRAARWHRTTRAGVVTLASLSYSY
jgi:hypothetical protein